MLGEAEDWCEDGGVYASGDGGGGGIVTGWPDSIIRALFMAIREARSTRKEVVAAREPETSSRWSRKRCADGPKLPQLSITKGTNVTVGWAARNAL